MAITLNEARDALKTIVLKWWIANARPLLGSQAKAQMISRIPGFDERELGYKNFASFARDCEGLAFRFRGTTDFSLVPEKYEKAAFDQPVQQAAELRLRIRNDFWQAFVGFAVPNQARAYDRVADRVWRRPTGEVPPDAILLAPIDKALQLKWRRDFVESLGPDSPMAGVLPALTEDGGFHAMAEALDAHPELRRRWHAVLVNHVAGIIRAWATPHGIPDEVWLTSEVAAVVPSDVARKRVYELLDTIPVEQLLEIRLPIAWILDIPTSGKPPKQ